MGGQVVRVVVRVGEHGQDLAGPRVDGHHRAGEVRELGLGHLLELEVEGGDHGSAALGPPEDLVDQVLGEKLLGPPGQVVVVGLLERAPSVLDGVVARLLSPQPAPRVRTQEPEVARRLDARGEHRPAVPGQDRAALDVELLEQQPVVGRVVREAVGGEHLQVVHLGEQDQEQDEEGEPEPPDLPVHADPHGPAGLPAPRAPRPPRPRRGPAPRSWAPHRAGPCRAASGPCDRHPAGWQATRRDPDQQREQDEVRHQARPPVRDEGQRDPGERDDPGDAGHDDERLEGDHGRQAHGQQLAEPVLAGDGRLEPPADEHDVAQQDRRGAEQAELLADRGEDEVGLRVRDQARVALAETRPPDAPGAQREHRLRQLAVPLVEHPRRVQGVQPHVHAKLDVGEGHVADVRPDREQQQPDDEVGRPAGRHPQHHHEDPEEQERRAEVLLQEQDGQGHRPGDDQRGEVLRLGQPERAEAAGRHGQEPASGVQIRGEEHDDQDLGRARRAGR